MGYASTARPLQHPLCRTPPPRLALRALRLAHAGARRGQAESADAADAVGAAGGLQILFPRAGQTLCHEDELELLALYDSSPLVPAGGVAVLEIDGRVASELH